MKEFTQEELEDVIKLHKDWLIGSSKGKKADLRDANLRNADLRDANLWNANLSNANLSNANLSNANLRNAGLSNADLRNAGLSNADLSNADLSNADLEKLVIQLPNICKWYIIYNEYNDKKLNIGCKSKTIKDWDKWFKTSDVFETNRDTNEFKLIELAFETIKKTIKLKSIK